jgi:6-phosphogluconolactonase
MAPPPVLFADKAAWALTTATLLAEDLRTALTLRPTALFAAAGGRTPGPILEHLAGIDLPWHRVIVTVTDDRRVGPDHPARNLTAAGRHMAAAVAQGAHLLALEDLPDPPGVDALLLGFGTDAHVASIFPNGEGMASARRLEHPPAVVQAVPAPLPPEAPFARISLNLAAICSVPRIMIAAQGADKRHTWHAAAADGDQTTPLAQLLQQSRVAVFTHLLIAP